MEDLSPLKQEIRAIRYINRNIMRYGFNVCWTIQLGSVRVTDVKFAESLFDLPSFAVFIVKCPHFLKKLKDSAGKIFFALCGGWLIRRKQKALLINVLVAVMKRHPRAMSMIIREFSKFAKGD